MPVVEEGPHVGVLAQHSVEARQGPVATASRSGNTRFAEPDPDLTHGQAILDMPGEDLAHDPSLWLEHLEAGREAAGGGKLAVAVRDLPCHYLTLASPEELAAPVALHDFGPLELGHRGLDLDQQPTLRVIRDPPFAEGDTDAEAGQLLQHDHLVDVVARQPIRAECDHRIDGPCRSGVTDLVQAGSIQSTPRVAIVEAGHLHLPTFRRGSLLQHLDLRADRAFAFLTLTGDAGVESHPHRHPPTAS